MRLRTCRLQKQISAFLASLKTDTSKQNRPDESLSQKSPMELDRQYRDIFKSVNALKDDLLKTQEQYDSIAMDLQDRADEKQEKAADIRKTFVTFKRTIARAAENSRTRRKIPLSAIKQFEAAEATKDHETRRQRMVFIQLKSKLKKAEINLREKEQLADGLHLIDFEQLKVMNHCRTVSEESFSIYAHPPAHNVPRETHLTSIVLLSHTITSVIVPHKHNTRDTLCNTTDSTHCMSRLRTRRSMRKSRNATRNYTSCERRRLPPFKFSHI